MDVVIAVIVNTRTGIILTEIDKPKDRLDARLYVRNVLDKEHGEGVYRALEFHQSFCNRDFIKKLIKSDNPKACDPLLELYIKYNLYKKQKELSLAETAYNEAVSAKEDCLSNFAQGSYQFDFVDEQLTLGIEQLGQSLESIKGSIFILEKELENR